jgi:nucleoside-diphosphate-sugar epimerase
MNNTKNSIFGSSGFIGKEFVKQFPGDCIIIPRNENKPQSSNILYFISTVDNYNVYDNPHLDIETNLTKLIDVLEECKKIKEQNKEQIVFNFISSWFVYGKTNELPAKETSICNPTGFYSITKHAAEKLLVSYCQTFGLNYRILRLTNIIGTGDLKVSKKKNALQFMIQNLHKNETVKIYDDGQSIRDYMDVRDCVRAIKVCLNFAPLNEIINISNCEPTTIKDLIFYSKDKLNSKSKIESIVTPDFHKIVQIQNMWLDNSKLLSYGYKQQITILESVDSIIKDLA